MAFRYTLRGLAAAESPGQILEAIRPVGRGMNGSFARGNTEPWANVVDVLRALGAQTLLVQRGVRDPDFLEEHQAFYSRQHRSVSRSCVRLHAFALPLPAPDVSSEERRVLEFLDVAARQQGYLGFVTIRPLSHAPVGATILKAPTGRRAKAKDSFPVHIAGIEFEVSGTPFLQQDNAVGACAQASIWMALRTLRRRQGNAAFSPAELTVAATRYLASDRTFPGRQGLTIHQMLEAIRFAGHDPLNLMMSRSPTGDADPTEVLGMAGPYIESGLPVIVALDAPGGGHAVVAVGQDAAMAQVRSAPRLVQETAGSGQLIVTFEPAASWCESLTIHNDNTGPYLELRAATTPPQPYALDHVVSLIVPLPDGIFMTAAEAEVMAILYLVRVAVMYTVAANGKPSLPEVPFVLRAVLVSRHAFRTWAKDDLDTDPAVAERYRTHELPPYVWLVEIHDAAKFKPGDATAKSRCGEVVLDAAADPLHADCLIFASVSGALWPSVSGLSGLLLIEEEEGVQAIGLSKEYLGCRIVRSW